MQFRLHPLLQLIPRNEAHCSSSLVHASIVIAYAHTRLPTVMLRKELAPLPRGCTSRDGALLDDGSEEGNVDGFSEKARVGSTVDGGFVGEGVLGGVGLTPSQLDELSAKL